MNVYYLGVRLSSLVAVTDESCQSQATIESMINRLQSQKRQRNDNNVQISSQLPTEHTTSDSQLELFGTNAAKRCDLSIEIDEALTSNEVNHSQIAVDNQTTENFDDSGISSDFRSHAVPSTLSGSKSISPTEMECPVCGIVNSWDLNGLNQHIDICLNRSVVRDILTSEKRTEPSDSRSTNPGIN